MIGTPRISLIPLIALPLIIYCTVSISHSSLLGGTDPWFDDIIGYPAESTDKWNKLATATQAVLFHGQREKLALLKDVFLDHKPRRLFLSLSDGGGEATIFTSQKDSVWEAWNSVINQAKSLASTGYQIQSVTLDIVAEVRERRKDGVLRSGVDGLAFDATSKLFLLPRQLQAGRIFGDKNTLNRQSLIAYVKTRGDAGVSLPLSIDHGYLFTTHEWFIRDQAIYRGNKQKDLQSIRPLVNEVDNALAELSKKTLSLQNLSGKFLVSNLSGKLNQSLDFETQGKAIWSMLASFEQSRNSIELRSARRGIDYILRRLQSCTWKNRSYLCPNKGKKNSLMASCYTALAVASYMGKTGYRALIPQLRQLMAGVIILSNQELKKLNFQRLNRSDQRIIRRLSFVQFVLSNVHKIDGTASYLEHAEKVSKIFLMAKNFAGVYGAIDDPMWAHLGLANLNQTTKNSKYSLLLRKYIEILLSRQIRGHSRKEWVGGFEPNVTALYTANQINGLVGAGRVFLNNPELLVRIQTALSLAVSNLLGFRVEQGSAIYYKNPVDTINVIKRSHSDSTIYTKDLAAGVLALTTYRQFLIDTVPGIF